MDEGIEVEAKRNIRESNGWRYKDGEDGELGKDSRMMVVGNVAEKESWESHRA